MNRPSQEVLRAIALVSETDHAVQLLARGLESLLRRDGIDIQSHSTQQLLSQGLERLLKLTIIFQYVRQNGDYPTQQQIKVDVGHNIRRAADRVAQVAAATSAFVGRPAAEADLDFVEHDPVLQLIIDALAGFGHPDGRYHDLNKVLGAPAALTESPEAAWQAVEVAARAGDDDLLARLASLDSGTHESAIDQVNRRIYAVI